MATPEALLISGILIHKDLNAVMKANFTSDMLIRHSPEMMFIEKNGIPSVSVFKATFPDFKVYKVTKEDIPLLMNQCRDNRIRLSTARLLKKTSNDISLKTASASDIVAHLEDQARKINMQFGVAKDVDIVGNWDDVFSDFVTRNTKQKAGETIGIPFDFPTMDKYVGGMMPSDMITVAARIGNLKTWMTLRFAASAILADKRVLYVSLEMSKEEISYRLWPMLAYMLTDGTVKDKLLLHNDKLIAGTENIKRLKRFLSYFKDKVDGSFIVPDIKGKFSIDHLSYKIDQHRPDIVLFDYFGLAVGNKGKVDNWMEAAAASTKCKDIARSYNIPFVLASQVNRAGADRVPQLQHISITDSIGADSDRVLTLQRKRSNLLLLSCAKNRHGQEGWRIYFETDVNMGKIKELRSVIDEEDEEDEGDD